MQQRHLFTIIKTTLMKKPLFFFALLLTCPLLLSAQTASNEADMQTFARQFMAAYNSGDHAALAKMYTTDAIRIDTDGETTKGSEQIAAEYAEQLRSNNATLLIRQNDLHWSDAEHAWVATGTYEIYGKSVVYDIDIDLAGHYANTMLEQKGKWKIAHSILTPLEHADPKVATNINMYTETWDAIINEGRFELFNEDHFIPDVVMHAEPENVVGIEGMKAYYRALLSSFSDGQFTVNNIFGEGDQLTKHWTFRGKHTSDFFGVPATGQEIVMTGSTIVQMSPDGRIAKEYDFMDNMAILTQMGVVSSPGNVAVIDGLYQAFAKGDIPAALAPMADGIVWNEAEGFPYADNNPYIGPDAVLNGVFARIGAEWEYWNLTDIALHEMSNNQVLATLRYDAKHKTTGKKLDAQTAHLWTLEGGKIVAFQQFTDTKQAMEATR